MTITLNIDENLISTEEKDRLKILFGIPNDEDNSKFEEQLQNITKAALVEYKQMLLGIELPTRAEEIKQYRLLHLIEYYFHDRIPTETEVSSMFQLTNSQSKSLIKNVLSKFHFQIEEILKNTMKSVLKGFSSTNPNREYTGIIQSDNIRDELNRIILRENPNLKLITLVRNSAAKYEIAEDSYDLLSKYFGLNVDIFPERVAR
ncbi:MAG: hypothetical protein ACERKV_03930 [Clostridiaceae bacterium]